jgi:hypothetical protein
MTTTTTTTTTNNNNNNNNSVKEFTNEGAQLRVIYFSHTLILKINIYFSPIQR